MQKNKITSFNVYPVGHSTVVAVADTEEDTADTPAIASVAATEQLAAAMRLAFDRWNQLVATDFRNQHHIFIV